MSSDGDTENYVNGDSLEKVKQTVRDRSKKVAQTKEILSEQAVKSKEILSKQAVKIAKQAKEHERFINKVTYLCSVLGFGAFCFLLGARPQVIPYVYCVFYVTFVPLRWIYYRFMKWHYYLLDFCYYANTIFLIMLLLFPRNEKLFMICFSFAEGMAQIASLPYVESKSFLWTWLFFVPLATYSIWQALYFLIVNVLRRQRLLRDPEVMTSYRELSKKAQKANNIWWHLSGLLGEQNRLFMYIMLQALFTVATMALTVPIFLSYRLHIIFQILKVSATVWNGGIFLLEVMPRQVVLKEKKKTVMLTGHTQEDQSAIALENTIKVDISAKNQHS
ncbi:hypothetical protein CsSME_00024723 [Camellia sinensis var. sinensis]